MDSNISRSELDQAVRQRTAELEAENERLHREIVQLRAEFAGRLQAQADEGKITSAHVAKQIESAVASRERVEELNASLSLQIAERKGMEVALQKSEEKYRTVLASIDEAFCIIEVLFDEAGVACDYRFLEVNGMFERHTGLRDVIGKTIKELAPRHEEHWYRIYGEVVKTGQPVRYQDYAKELKRWFDVYALRIGRAELCQVAVVFADITEHKRDHEALLASEGRLSFLLSLADELRALSDPGAIMRVAAESLGRRLGVAAAGFADVHADGEGFTMGGQYGDGRMPDLAAMRSSFSSHGPGFAAVLHAGREIVYEDIEEDPRATRNAAATKTMGVVAGAAIPIFRAGRLVCFLYAVHPVRRPWTEEELRLMRAVADRSWVAVERVRAEEALRNSQDRLRLIVENTREYAIMATDLHRQVVYWNLGAERLLGYTEGEILGTPADVIFTAEDQEAGAPLQEAMTAIREGRAADERWHVRKNGSRFWGSGMMMSMRAPGGEVIGLVKIFRDQTEEMRARRELEQSQAELREALQGMEKAREQAELARKAKDHFLAVLSHELRTPLTPVLMAVSTLSRQKNLSPLMQESLGMILRNIQLEARFIDELLDITRIERGKLELTLEPINLHEVIHRAIEISNADLADKEQQLQVKLEAGDDHVCGDALRLQQVFWNLLKNASKFTPEKGRIEIASRNEPGRILVTVTDSGIGFSPSSAERIFDAFSQANVEVTKRYGGLGLGLAIAKATVDGHGGALHASSEGEGTGAQFTVTLRLTEPAS